MIAWAALSRACRCFDRAAPLLRQPEFIFRLPPSTARADCSISSTAYRDIVPFILHIIVTLLLYRSGFYVGKYISLEAKIAKNKDMYYAALRQAQTGWHEGTEDAVPFIKYLLGTILAVHKDFEDGMAIHGGKRTDGGRVPCQRFGRKNILNIQRGFEETAAISRCSSYKAM